MLFLSRVPRQSLIRARRKPIINSTRSMASVNDLPQPYLTHLQRTAQQDRGSNVHAVTLSKITPAAGGSINLLHLDIDRAEGIKFLPGQWLDVHIPTVEKVGGFTITSSPLDAHRTSPSPYLELAVQNSPKNPPAAYFFRPAEEIIGQNLYVRVGGNFVWPPFRYLVRNEGRVPKRAVFIAGGVGINPLISMLTHMHRSRATMPENVQLLYATKGNSLNIKEVLFANRIISIASEYAASRLQVQFFLTTAPDAKDSATTAEKADLNNVLSKNGRITRGDIEEALGDVEDRRDTVCYVCGPRQMTDELVEMVGKMEGMEAERVLCEKWW